VDCEDAGWARLGREVSSLGTAVDERLQAVVAEADVLLCFAGSAGCWRADGHSEALKPVSIE
jgi:hypothetical protein